MRLYYFLFAIPGRLTDEMKTVADAEGKTPEFILRSIASGRIVIPCSPYRYTRPVGIGKGLRTKVNASIDTLSDIDDIEMEVEKARVAQGNGDYCALKIIKENIDLSR